MDNLAITEQPLAITEQLCEGRRILALNNPRRGAAILIPLIATGQDDYELLYEVRAAGVTQPGEVCFPGGHMEADESPAEAALRETREELLVGRDQLELIGELGCMDGPGGIPLWVYVGMLRAYEGSFDPAEVASTFTVALTWLLSHDPELYEGRLIPQMDDELPWELLPDGKDYQWKTRPYTIPFYRDHKPVIWGATARITARFIETLKAGGRR